MNNDDEDLGEYWLDRYAEDHDATHLSRAVTAFEAALTAEDANLPWLWHMLALTHQERGSGTDWDRAVSYGRLSADALVPGEVRDDVLADLAHAYGGRLEAGPGDDLAQARTTAAEIALIGAEVTSTAAVVRIEYALTLARVAALSDDPADLDAAIAELTAVADRAEKPDPLVHHDLARAHQARWEQVAEPPDLDAAIVHWRVALAEVPDPEGMAECGLLLGERAELAGPAASAEDVDEAIDRLARAANAGEPSWWALGLAHLLRHGLGGDPADRTRAAACMDRALADPPSPGWLIDAYRERLELARQQLQEESATDPAVAAPSSRVLLRLIEAARAAFDSGAGDNDDRARLAVSLAINSVLLLEVHSDRVDGQWMADMVAAGRTMIDKPPDWDRRLDTVEALARYVARAQSGGGVPGDGLDELIRPLQTGEPDPEMIVELTRITPLFLAAKAVQSGDLRLLRTAVTQLRGAAEPEERLMGDVFELVGRAQQGDLTVHEPVREMIARVRTMPLSYAARKTVTPLLALLDGAFAGKDGAYRPIDSRPLPDGDLTAATDVLLTLPAPAHAAVIRHDVAALRQCGDRLDELLAVLPAGHVLRLMALGLGGVFGVALLRDEPGDQPTTERLLRWSAEGLAVADGAHHPLWSALALARAEALRHRGSGDQDSSDRAESRRWGLAGLRGFAWQVLLQAGTDDAVAAAAEAGEAARRVAGWCQEDGATDDLVAALDAGRGLVLQAATASRTIADRLALAGRPDLAEQWRASAGYGRDQITGTALRAAAGAVFEVPDDLRSEVLHRLELSAPEPASTAEIRTALAAAGRDALVYLLPMRMDQPGTAVIVPAHGPVSTLVLPGLRTDRRSAFAQHAGTLHGAGRDAAVTGGAREPGRGPDALCGWAWTTAMGALLRHVEGWGLGRPARLVLVPTEALSAVPWHAAFRSQDGVRRYVVESAIISYAVSGRAVAQSAREPIREVRAALVLGDPTGDLPFAGVEARAIGRAFYPDGAYLGRADDSGTPRQVLEWVAAAAPGPSLLHLACHGRAFPARPADACLLLRGGELTARRLLEASRTAELEIERVFLAACATGVVGQDHDEAFSLATAFLSAGARTVFGSLWRVPDEETSVLMFVVHHELNVNRCQPAEALHRAQLWMLDPDRVAPPEMPPELRRHCDSPRLADPVAWAGFTHQGR